MEGSPRQEDLSVDGIFVEVPEAIRVSTVQGNYYGGDQGNCHQDEPQPVRQQVHFDLTRLALHGQICCLYMRCTYLYGVICDHRARTISVG